MKKINATIILALTFSVSAIAADNYTIDANHTYPMFEVSHFGFSTQRGRFNKTSGKITLDISKQKGSVDLIIETTSLDMGFALWNEHMSVDGFFNTAKFPTMTFQSNKLIFKDDKVVAAEGDFTLLGVTKPLTVTVNDFRCGDHPMKKGVALCGANITGTFKRSEFGMIKNVPIIGDDIKISVSIEAVKN